MQDTHTLQAIIRTPAEQHPGKYATISSYYTICVHRRNRPTEPMQPNRFVRLKVSMQALVDEAEGFRGSYVSSSRFWRMRAAIRIGSGMQT